ncbi:MAG: glycoside hydrolase family 3 C-terminal domain-containing protein [Pseudomonadales bacterium]
MDRTAAATSVDIDALLQAMSLEEKVSLLAGRSFWITTAVPRLGVPAIKVTDGPNGARGDGVSGATAASLPVGSALGSTWNLALVREVGRVLGEEALTKNAQVLLGPTINLHRTPLGGRNFECYSEDPYLSGLLACAFIDGVQSTGVGACPKHFVANDSEYQRHSISSEVDERTLRELYLTPFELAVTRARPWSLMSSYNRINGTFASSHRALLRDLLKDQWGFDGVVVSDWGAALETEANLNGGLDLEMPGPTRTRGQALVEAVRGGRVAQADVDDSVRRMLRLIARSGRFDAPDPVPEAAVDRPEHRAVARRAAAEGMVLIRNEGLLPLDPARVGNLAVIGPNARNGQIQGGGSSAVFPHYQVMPLEGLRRAGNWTVQHSPGCFNHKYLPLPAPGRLTCDGEPGCRLRLFPEGSDIAALERMVELTFNPMGGLPLNMIGAGRVGPAFTATLEAEFVPEVSGSHQFGLMSSGLTRLFIDDVEVIDNWTAQERGDAFFGWGSSERRAAIDAEAGRSYRFRIEFQSAPDVLVSGVRYGILPPHTDDMIEQAARTAAAADAAVLVVGSNADWETEGNDRRDMSLPGDQLALIDAVLSANPNTLIVVNTGAAVDMPWLQRAPAVLQAWLPGQEFGNALADVITGRVNPSGRMPTTVPLRLQDTPAYTSYPGEAGRVLYGERLFMGYRWYDARDLPVRVPFGHGLSYTQFDYSDLEISGDLTSVTVRVAVRNVGRLAGQEVVQLYLRATDAPVQRPEQELRAFAKPSLAPGERTTVQFTLTPRDFAYWDVTRGDWLAAAGNYEIRVGASSRDIRLRASWQRGADVRVA